MGCFGNMLVLLFGLLFFLVYSLTAIYPQGTEASSLVGKGKKRHEIDIIPLNTAQICRENTVIHWQCLKIKHIFLARLQACLLLNLLFNYCQLLKTDFFLYRYEKTIFPLCSTYRDAVILMVKGSGEMQQFIQINSVQIIHDWSHGVLAPYLQ